MDRLGGGREFKIKQGWSSVAEEVLGRMDYMTSYDQKLLRFLQL